jgi:hypothetical protein
LIARLESNGHNREEIQNFLLQPNAVLTEGRMLYPRMYRKGDGLSSANPWPAYAVQDFPRIGFILINHEVHNIYFPTRELLDFSQGVDTIVLACDMGDNFLEARVVNFGNTSHQSGTLDTPCPNP